MVKTGFSLRRFIHRRWRVIAAISLASAALLLACGGCLIAQNMEDKPYTLTSMQTGTTWSYHCPPVFSTVGYKAYLHNGVEVPGWYVLTFDGDAYLFRLPKEAPSYYETDCHAPYGTD